MDYVKKKELAGEINHSEKRWRSFIECLRNEECELLAKKTPQIQTKINLKLEQKPKSFKMERNGDKVLCWDWCWDS